MWTDVNEGVPNSIPTVIAPSPKNVIRTCAWMHIVTSNAYLRTANSVMNARIRYLKKIINLFPVFQDTYCFQFLRTCNPGDNLCDLGHHVHKYSHLVYSIVGRLQLLHCLHCLFYTQRLQQQKYEETRKMELFWVCFCLLLCVLIMRRGGGKMSDHTNTRTYIPVHTWHSWFLFE